MSEAVPTQALLGEKSLMETGNKWINLTLKTWLNIVTDSGLFEEIKILRFMRSHDFDFVPNKLDVSCKGWVNWASPNTMLFLRGH